MERITPEKAVDILKINGTFVTENEASIILDFLRKLADIAIEQYLRNSTQFSNQKELPLCD